MSKDFERFKEAVKLLALYQVTLEQMDVFAGTKLYKQSIKNKMRSLEKDLELTIKSPMSSLDKIDFELFQEIQLKVEMILDLTVEDLVQLKAVIENSKDNESI